MDLPWGDERSLKFITNVGLVTTNGPNGHNVMACEWTHHISYKPGLIAVCIRPGKATHENIASAKEFGVSLCAAGQSVLSSVAGGYTGKEYDKIAALREFGFEFYKAEKIDTLMVKGAAMNAECRLADEIKPGSHTVFIGEVLTASAGAEPLAYHGGRYWNMETPAEKPSEAERQRIRSVVEKHKK